MPSVGVGAPVGPPHAAEITNSLVHALQFCLQAQPFGAENLAVARFQSHQFGDGGMQRALPRAASSLAGCRGGVSQFLSLIHI